MPGMSSQWASRLMYLHLVIICRAQRDGGLRHSKIFQYEGRWQGDLRLSAQILLLNMLNTRQPHGVLCLWEELWEVVDDVKEAVGGFEHGPYEAELKDGPFLFADHCDGVMVVVVV